MKKLLLLTLIILSSCTAENNDRQQSSNCSCETIKATNVYRLPNGYVWTVSTLENDCTGAQRQDDLVGVHSIGEKICN